MFTYGNTFVPYFLFVVIFCDRGHTPFHNQLLKLIAISIIDLLLILYCNVCFPILSLTCNEVIISIILITSDLLSL